MKQQKFNKGDAVRPFFNVPFNAFDIWTVEDFDSVNGRYFCYIEPAELFGASTRQHRWFFEAELTLIMKRSEENEAILCYNA